MQCLVRLKKELERLQCEPPAGISCWQTETLHQLKASIIGPDGSPYENAVFHLDVQIPERYPFVPPNVRFVTPVYHPNIDDSGRICLDILKSPPNGAWKPSLNLASILITIQLLMAEPNFNDPLMNEIAREYQMSHSSYVKHAKEWTVRYAQPSFSSGMNSNIPVPRGNNTDAASNCLMSAGTSSGSSDVPCIKKRRLD